MKKLIAALFAAVLMSAGMVVATGGAASADCSPNNYAGCVATKTKATGPGVVVKGKKATLCAEVTTRASNATATGRVVIKVKRNAGGFFFKSAVDYKGGDVCVKTGALNKTGGYTVLAKYKATSGSAFINSRGGTGFDVVS